MQISELRQTESSPTGLSTDAEEDFLREARERFQFGLDADQYDRERAEDDNKFTYADDKDLAQWDERSKKARKKRPVLQWNRLPTYVHQVSNDGRENKPAIKISAGDGGKTETAEFLQARIRHIEYECNADTARDTARDQQITSGRGFIRVRTERIPGTFNQRVCIDRIENQFSVVWDPAACKYDRSDADWAFVISLISKQQHIRAYGKNSVIGRLNFADCIKMAPDWIGVGERDDLIQIAEYFVKEYQKRRLLELVGGDGSVLTTIWKDQLTEQQFEEFRVRGLIRQQADQQFPTVMQYVINGAEVLKKTEWLGSTIPIIPVWGKEAVVGDRRRTYSLIRNAKHPQMMLNLLVSNLAEKLAQMAKAPYKIPVGGIPKGSETDWQNAHLIPLAYLLYNQWDEDGRKLDPPTQVDYEPPIQSIVLGIREAIDAIKASMGIYDAALGAKSNETSGLAIRTRQKESDVSNFHFPDNEARSNKYLGEILVEIVPKLDRKGMNVPIRTEDGKTHVVPIGVPHKDWKTGEMVTHDLLSGQYGVTASSGPSYTAQRQEEAARDATLISAQPELMWSIGPHMLRSEDAPGAEERAQALERYINMKFPGLIPPKPTDDGAPAIPQEVQQQMQMLQQKLQETDGFARSLHDQLQNKKLELDNDIKIKQMELDFKYKELAISDENKKLEIASKESIEQLQHDIDILKTERQHVMETQKLDRKHQQDIEKMRQQHQQAKDIEAQGLDHEADQAEADRQAATEGDSAQREHEAEQAGLDRVAQAAQAETAAAASKPNASA